MIIDVMNVIKIKIYIYSADTKLIGVKFMDKD